MTGARLDHCGPLSQQQERVAAFARECGLELQCEVLKALVTAGDALDELGSCVHPLQRADADAVLPSRQNAEAVVLQHPCERRCLLQVMVLRQGIEWLYFAATAVVEAS